MKYRTRDIAVGLIVIAVVVAAGLIYRNSRKPEATPSPTPFTNREELIEGFNYQIPDDTESIELKNVADLDGRAIATRKYEDSLFTHAILADLPDPEIGSFYEGWLVRGKEGDENFSFISTGKLRIAKGGYLLEFSSTTDYSEYSGVVITKEIKDDKTPETHVLEGSF